MFRATALAAVVTLATGAWGASMAGAQDAVLAELYGRGVHRYFALDYDQAYENLSLAIDNGLRDPRAYYFRGLAAAATGRQDEALGDWRLGAEIEARGNYSGSIGRALARIQGAQRLELEEVRRLVRLEHLSRSAAENRARYEAIEAAEPRVLRNAVPVPPAPAAAAPAAPAPAPGAPAVPVPPVAVDPLDSSTNPFADDPGMAVGEPTLESENALGDPLNQPAPAAAEPAAPAADAMEDEAPDTDPFGAFGSGDDSADPFGN